MCIRDSVQRGHVHLRVHPQPGRLRLRPRLADLAGPLRLRSGQSYGPGGLRLREPYRPGRLGVGQAYRPGRLGLRPHGVRRRVLLRLPARVRAPLVHQLLLAAGEFDLAGQFVLRDGALPLDGHRPPFVRRPVRLLLDLLAGRCAQRPLHLGFRTQRHDPYGDDLDAGRREAGFRGQARRDPLPYRLHPVHQGRRQRRTGEHVQRVLLCRLRQERAQLLQRCATPGTRVGVDGEVQTGRGRRRVADPVGDRRLHGHVLEVGGAGVEGHRQLTVVHRHFRERRGQCPEPEAEAGAVVQQSAAAVVADVRRGRAAQMAPAQAPGDVGHAIPSPISRHPDDKRKAGLSSRGRKQPGARVG